ncbi:hypothetical protein DA717_09280 [Piscirickettsiaceae bacterium NZ-RLO2]|uniref:ParD-like family protein n=1 Tax=Piscirickettsia salmonis TaxID=1238 RepID=UPI0007C90B0E|nr:ParD-like family protein [Piscirickettsia salmonis]OAJ33175.1 hypothetical protein A0O36_02627 [Piscirickettsiaceae bacterium NZ-RLO1]RNC77609.1 hypothetical protein DA717_09280 [Piscirickettsiaceae bacterium NZ-RLO2]QGP56699.1 hypothetical protein PsalSR1_04188 [Piscirickettsia salmonis]QGP61686.1 hypothetical protein PsalBI1_04328 [Piscirickettsia salmonis]QGP66267.1 hypothetical protein PsalMR5_04192 [Piscirickettsia salmonis]
MAQAVSLDQELVNDAKSHANVFHRSISKQIEHWARVGQIVEDNPDLPYSMIKEIMLGLEDVHSGNVEEYTGKL